MAAIDAVTKSREDFFLFVDKCNELYRSGHDLDLYRKLVQMHRQHGGLDALLEDHQFLSTAHRTLSL